MPEQTTAESKRGMKRIGSAVACGALACALGVGTAAAYLTGAVSVQNPFTLNTDLKIQLTEPSFSTEAAKNLKPLQTVAKDPTVTNSGSVDAYIAADVKVPLFSGSAIVDGKAQQVTNADLFTYALNSGWKQIGNAKDEGGFRTYRYIYDAELGSGEQAPSIFDAVTLANLTEDVGITETSLDVTAYAIQSEGFANATEACDAYDTQAHATATVSA